MKAKKPEQITGDIVKPATAPKPLGKSTAAAKPAGKPAPAVKSAAGSVKPSPAAATPVVKKAKAEPVEAVKQSAEAAKAAKAEKELKTVKKPKLKVVRDSFTMPHSEYVKIAEIKELCLKAGVQVKKSEVLRAGVIALCAMNEAQLKGAMSALDKIKTGRPNKQ
jgi:hypothetical protein